MGAIATRFAASIQRWVLALAVGFALMVGVLYVVLPDRQTGSAPIDPGALRDRLRAENPGAMDNEQRLLQMAEMLFPDPAAATDPEQDLERTAQPRIGETDDPEWREFPRSDFELVKLVGPLPELDCRRLLRHVRLNPADRYIPKAQRENLLAQWAERKQRLSFAKEQIRAIAQQEFDLLVARGWARTIHYADYLKTLTPEELAQHEASRQQVIASLMATGKTAAEAAQIARKSIAYDQGRMFPGGSFMVRADADRGTIQAALLRELPQAAQAAELYKAAALAALGLVVDWFVRHDALPPGQVAGILEEFERELQRLHPT